jgi:ABC-type amino acid transport substrate-binding protein
MTCERLKNRTGVGRFTLPTFANGLVITTRTENADKVKSFEDLAGKNIGVENVGTIPDRVVTAAQKITKFEKVVFADNPSLFLALEEGRIDAVTQAEFPTLWQTRGNARVKIAARVPGTYFPAGFVLKDEDPLHGRFNEVLNNMKTDGAMVKIYRIWFDADPASESPTGRVVPEVTPASAGCQ